MFFILESLTPPTHQGKSGVDAQELTHSLHAKYHCDEIKQGLKGYCHDLGSGHTTGLDSGKRGQDQFTYTVLRPSSDAIPLMC